MPDRFGYLKNLRHDLPAGTVVFLVAMPLSLGIAFTSGAALFSGIIAGFMGSLVVTILSDSPLGVSGSAVGLTVIILTAIQDLGSFQVFLLAVILAGMIQVILGYMRAGIFGYYLPSAVIMPDDCDVIIDGSRNKSIHPDVLEIIEDFRHNAPTRHIKVEIKDLNVTMGANSLAQFHHYVVLQNEDKKQSKRIIQSDPEGA